MSLLHSFYCWGSVGVVLLSHPVFRGIWGGQLEMACLHLGGRFLCTIFTILPPVPSSLWWRMEKAWESPACFRVPMFWTAVILMVCAGASETVPWPSGLPPTRNPPSACPKQWVDLAGPCLFAVTMGISRVIYGKYGDRMNLMSFMMGSGGLCLICYLMASISANPMIGLIGCILCGFSVGIMWPGTISISSQRPSCRRHCHVRSSGHGGGSGRSVWPRPGGSRYPECRRTAFRRGCWQDARFL